MTTSQLDFEKFLIIQYFKYGSINNVYSIHRFNLPISFASYYRVLSKFRVIKSAGPNSHLSESLHILTKISTYKIPLERAYHQYAPSSIRVSINTIHRIIHYIRLGLTRRQGTALLITQVDQPDAFLTGFEAHRPVSTLGQRGDLALPMSHSKIGEDPKDAIARVLQQEVFSDLVIDSTFPWEVIPSHPKPIFFINIADIKVAVYHLKLPAIFQFSSFKLKQLQYRNSDEISNYSIRPGVEEICQKYLVQESATEDRLVPEFTSKFNLALAKIKA